MTRLNFEFKLASLSLRCNSHNPTCLRKAQNRSRSSLSLRRTIVDAGEKQADLRLFLRPKLSNSAALMITRFAISQNARERVVPETDGIRNRCILSQPQAVRLFGRTSDGPRWRSPAVRVLIRPSSRNAASRHKSTLQLTHKPTHN